MQERNIFCRDSNLNLLLEEIDLLNFFDVYARVSAVLDLRGTISEEFSTITRYKDLVQSSFFPHVHVESPDRLILFKKRSFFFFYQNWYLGTHHFRS